MNKPTTLAGANVWSGLVPQEDLEIYEAAGYGASQEPGTSPAILVIDCNYRFFGRQPLPIREAVREMRTSCGQFAWDTVPTIAALLAFARKRDIPVIYSTSPEAFTRSEMQAWRSKNTRVEDDFQSETDDADIVREIAPLEGEIVIRKLRPSVFFGTDLKSELERLGVDSIVCVGGSTSGCVRGTAVDAFSHGIQVTVLSDATFDRSDFIHRLSLFDMQAKYANVLRFSDWAKQRESAGQ